MQQGSQWLFPWGDPKLYRTEMTYQGISVAFESNAGQSMKRRGVKPKGSKQMVDQGDGCSPPNLIPRASGPSAVTVATTIATMAAVMASANP
jgi:hypothetical protein